MEVALGGLEIGVAEDVLDGHRVEHAGQESAGGVAQIVEARRRDAGRVAGDPAQGAAFAELALGGSSSRALRPAEPESDVRNLDAGRSRS